MGHTVEGGREQMIKKKDTEPLLVTTFFLLSTLGGWEVHLRYSCIVVAFSTSHTRLGNKWCGFSTTSLNPIRPKP